MTDKEKTLKLILEAQNLTNCLKSKLVQIFKSIEDDYGRNNCLAIGLTKGIFVTLEELRNE